MLEMNDKVPSFAEFRLVHTYDRPISIIITESGKPIPEEQWEDHKEKVSSTRGLNFGKDSEEFLHKFVRKTDSPGEMGKLTVTSPITVRIDRSEHAGHQIYRWEHREDQVTWKEALDDIELALPVIVECVNQGLRLGSATDYLGMLWLYNLDTRLNMILQVKKQEQPGSMFKIVIVTILRERLANFKMEKNMPKITIEGGKAFLAHAPMYMKTSR